MLSLIVSLATFLFLLFHPGVALAWGPMTHLDLCRQALGDLLYLTPAIALLIRRHLDHYYYGCIASDIIIAKNLAPYLHHCHNWQVGSQVLEGAGDEPARAFAYGYLSHLAADIIAHNYFVPFKLVENYSARSARHTYWEMRMDALAPPEIWELVRRISKGDYTEHDKLLEGILKETLFSFKTNRRIFSRMLLMQRLTRWQNLIAAIDRRSPLPLEPEEAAEYRRLAVDSIREFLLHPATARCRQVDPTGGRNLKVATNLRKRLRKLQRQRQLPADVLHRVGGELRHAFRQGIHGKLELPELPVPRRRRVRRVKRAAP